MQAALPYLVESRGAVVNISSVMSTQHIPAQIAYNASKAMQDAVGNSADSQTACACSVCYVNIAAFATILANQQHFAMRPFGVLLAYRHAVSELCLQVTKNYAMAYAKDGVRVNSVNPGYTVTDVFGEPQPAVLCLQLC